MNFFYGSNSHKKGPDPKGQSQMSVIQILTLISMKYLYSNKLVNEAQLLGKKLAINLECVLQTNKI